MSHLKLYSNLGNFRANKILIAAELSGVNIEFVPIASSDLKSEQFLSKNPLGKVPVLETSEGCIFESNAIIRYIARLNPNSGLYGNNVLEQSLIDQWLDFSNGELDPNIVGICLPILGWIENDQLKTENLKTDTVSLLTILDNHLKSHQYFVGSKITIADITLASLLVIPFKTIFDEQKRKLFTNVTKWFQLIADNAAFQKFFGKVWLCKVAFPTPVLSCSQEEQKPCEKKSEQCKKQCEKQCDKPCEQKEKKQKEHKPQEEGKHTETKQKKTEAKSQPKAEEDDDAVDPTKKPPKSALDLLPPSTFDLFNFKTQFFQTNKEESLKFFWDNFDKNGYSIWYLSYQKYEGEGIVDWQTNNMKNGVLQKAENFRKYVFGTLGVYGKEKCYEIRGIWVWRGVGIPQEIKDLDCYAFYTWKQLSLENQADKDLIQTYWLNVKENDLVEGLPVYESTYFK